jgi:hypothetical protein
MQLAVNFEAPSPLMLAAQAAPGRVWLLVFSFLALLPGFGYRCVPFVTAIGLSSFFPQRRRSIVSSLAIAVCVLNFGSGFFFGGDKTVSLAALAMVATWVAVLLVWTRFAGHLPGAISRHSLLLLHVGAVLILGGLWALQGRGILSGTLAGTMCTVVPELLWRSSYWIKWRLRQTAPPPIWNNLFAALPFAGVGGVPIGKGPGYLATYEARDRLSLAAAQVEGARLLALALLWRGADGVLGAVLWRQSQSWLPGWILPARPQIPTMGFVMRLPLLFPLWQRWAALYGELFHTILTLAIFGHTLVGIFCLVGFRIPRNMKAPLLSTTLLDFWGRYYFYFKELLMDFWFFPAFLQASRLPVVRRSMLATVAAACVGNFYYHLVLYWPPFAAGDTRTFQAQISARAIYCIILSAGLCASFARQLRRQGPRVEAGLPRRIFQLAMVSAFFAVLHVWNFGGGPLPLHNRWELWVSLVRWR